MNVEQIIIVVLSGVVSFLCGVIFNFLVSKYKNKTTNDTAIRKGVQALLRDRLRQDYILYTSQGYATDDDKDNFSNMYQQYHNLGKNGVIDGKYKEVMQLPLHKSK